MIQTTGVERLEPPAHLVRLLTTLGGTNCYGEPHFIIFWGQTHQPRGVCPHRLLGENRPCWNLAMWRSPEEWGPPEDWDYNVLGEYPSRGAYDLIQPFYRSAERPSDGIVAMPLSYGMVEAMISIIARHKNDSLAKRKMVFAAEQEARDKERERHIEDVIQDAVPAYLDAASYAGQTNKKTFLQQKIEELERWSPKIPRRRGPFIRGARCHQNDMQP